MMRILRGQWIASLITGLILLLLGAAIQLFIDAPAPWLMLVLVASLVGVFVVAFIVDRKGQKMTNNEPEPTIGISLEDCGDANLSNNTFIGLNSAIRARRVKGLRADNNQIESPKKEDD